MAFALVDGARAGHDHGVLGDDEGGFGGGADDIALDEIEDGRAAGEDGSGGKHGAFADDGAFVDAAVAADEHVVFDHDRAGVDRLEHAADLCCRAEVNPLADLRAGTHEGVRIDHGAFVDLGAGIDVHGRHAYHAAREVGAGTDRRAAGHDADAVVGSEMPRRVSMLVDKRKVRRQTFLRERRGGSRAGCLA